MGRLPEYFLGKLENVGNSKTRQIFVSSFCNNDN